MHSVIFTIRARRQAMEMWDFYGKWNQERGKIWNSRYLYQDMVREEIVGEQGLVKILSDMVNKRKWLCILVGKKGF